MENGYYLSTYLHINELGHLMDLSARHDQNIALWRKNVNKIELVHYWELERVTGLKMHKKFFYNRDHAVEVINNLLKKYNLSLNDMNEVWGTPGLDTCDDYHSMYDYPDFAYHAVSHLFSSIMIDSGIFYNNKIIGLAADGAPDSGLDLDWVKKPFYVGSFSENSKVDMFKVYSPAIIWAFAARHYKLREGTLMALASASKSQAYIPGGECILIEDEKSANAAFEYLSGIVKKVDGFQENDQGVLFNYFDPLFSIQDNKISMVMKIIQEFSIRIMEKNIDNIIERFNVDPSETYLALSGGYALNCPTNSYLMKKYKFKGFIAPPCVSDTGMSLGIALYAFYKKMGNFEFKMEHAYYGDRDEYLNSIVNDSKYSRFIASVSDFDVEKAVEDLMDSPIVWFDGAAEVGPRALGNRSILADPRSESVKDRLNQIKKRQWWRPVAPIVLEEYIDEWFEEAYPSPFMLHTFKIRQNKLAMIPSIAHLDDSSRVQTIGKDSKQKDLYGLISKFRIATGIPIICNTSLNDNGEPIINKIEQAINFALRKGIRVAYVNTKRVELCNHEEYDVKGPLRREINFVRFMDEERDNLIKTHNPYNLNNDALNLFLNYRIDNVSDLTKKNDARILDLYTKSIAKKYTVDIEW